MWIIASIPFWMLGIVMTVSGCYALFRRRPGETNADLVWQFILGLSLGGILLIIAAKIAS